MDIRRLKEFLDRKVEEYNRPAFILNDPISIPHRFSKKQDIEIAGFFAAIFSWGNRTTIIQKTNELMQRMDNAPYEFCLNHSDSDLKKLTTFKHRTFNATDLLYFVAFLQYHYQNHESLEDAFFQKISSTPSFGGELVGAALDRFLQLFFFAGRCSCAHTQTYCITPKKINLQKIEYVSPMDGRDRMIRR